MDRTLRASRDKLGKGEKFQGKKVPSNNCLKRGPKEKVKPRPAEKKKALEKEAKSAQTGENSNRVNKSSEERKESTLHRLP